MTPSKFKVLIVLGKSGSGKGTQVEKLAQKYNLKVISSGNLLRARQAEGDFVGRRIGEIIDNGGLVPTPVIFHMWLHELEIAKNDGTISGVIFEGSPRKLYEAWMLDETLWFYHLDGNAAAFHIKVSDDEAQKRLLARARVDDTAEAIRERLSWYREQVMPAVNYYREKGKLIEINGEQSIEDVEREIAEKAEEFFGNDSH